MRFGFLMLESKFITFVDNTFRRDAITNITTELDIALIFSGETSQSKGHSLIKRFSEDSDFRKTFKPFLRWSLKYWKNPACHYPARRALYINR